MLRSKNFIGFILIKYLIYLFQCNLTILTLFFQILSQTPDNTQNMEKGTISKQEKQNFLRNEILEGGIDAESFMDYMGTVKNQGQNINIDNWTLQQLKKVVHDFKQQIQADTETLEIVKQSQIRQSKQMLSKIIKSVMKKEKVSYDKGMWDFQMDNQQQCRKIQKPFQFNPKIKPKVQITGWQVRTHGGFFLGFGATKQLWLKVQTNFTKQRVQRNNSDVQWYRNALLKFHPGSYIPPLAQLRAVEPQDKKGLTHRSKIIEQFLNSVIQYEYLIQSQISKVFFTEPDHTKFTNYKSKERNIGHTKNVASIETLQGKFHLQISQKNQKFIKHSSLFGRVAQQTYADIQIQLNKVLSDMETLSKHVLYISNSCGTLHQKYMKICGLNDIKDSTMDIIMSCLNNMLSNIGKSIKDQMGLIKEFSDDYIQYSIRSWEEYLLHDKKYQKQLENYLTFKSELIRKKERYFADPTKWELESREEAEKAVRMNIGSMDKQEVFAMMFPRDNKTEEQLRVWVAYLNKAYEQSFKTLLKEEQNQLRQKLHVYLQRTTNLSKQSHLIAKQTKNLLGVNS